MKTLFIALAVLLPASPTPAQDVPPAPAAAKPASPDADPLAKLKPYTELAAKLEAYQSAIRGDGWAVKWQAKIGPQLADDTRFHAPPEEGDAGGELTAQTDGSTPVLQLAAATTSKAFIAAGPTVTGEFAFEFVGKAVSDRPCDLTITCDGIGAGPTFQFGANYNERNILWTRPDKKDPNGIPASVRTELRDATRIVKDQWHRVRIEVRDGTLRAFVDGKEIGSAPLPEYDLKRPRQPMIYCYGSTILVKEIRTEIPGEKKAVDKDAVWKKVVGDQTPEQIAKKIDALADFLEDDAFEVREAAEQLLTRLGPASIPAVRRLEKSGSAEAQMRAAAVLRTVAPATQPAK